MLHNARDCQHVGTGLPALKYLSRYLYRGVIAEKKYPFLSGWRGNLSLS
jgi:hypothetical protein